MPDQVIFSAALVLLCFGGVHGILMLVSPPRHRRFVFRLTTLFHRSTHTTEDRHDGFEIEYRIGGLCILAMCIWMAWEVLKQLLRSSTHDFSGSSVSSVVLAGIGGNWVSLSAGILVAATGTYFLAKPEAAYLWSINNLPIRNEIPSGSKRKSVRRGMQLFGALFVAAGLSLLGLGVYSLMHPTG